MTAPTQPSPAPRVSVIIIFLNGEAYLADAIRSVLGQTFQDFELLLCDDGSDPPATAIAKSFVAADPRRVRYLEHPGHENRGMSTTRNLGLYAARGDLIAFIDADDVWEPNKLEDQVAVLDAHPEVGMVGGAVRYWSSWEGGDDEVTPTAHVQDQPIPSPEALLCMYPFGDAPAPCPSDLIIRRKVLVGMGGFVDAFRGMYEDQAFLSKIYLATSVYFDSRVWLNYRQHQESCVAVTHAEGRYREIQTFFCRWFSEYIGSLPGPLDPRIRPALARLERRIRRPRLTALEAAVRGAQARARALFVRAAS